MTEWMLWLSLAGLLVILELFVGTFYLLVIAFGMAAGGLAAWTGASSTTQIICAGVVGVIGTYFVWRSKFGKSQRIDPKHDPNINLDIGQSITVKEWDEQGGIFTARTMYRGALWDVELEPGVKAEPGVFTISEVRGSRLILTGNKVSH